MAAGTTLGEVNTDESIMVLIDEAHRRTPPLGREPARGAAQRGLGRFTGTRS